MAVTVELSTLSAEGLVTVSGGTQEQRKLEGLQVTPGTYTTARGRLVLDEDGETVKFVPLDQEELDDVIAADEA
jgi:hypothetical protein